MKHPAGLETTDYEPQEIYTPNRWQLEHARLKACEHPMMRRRPRPSVTMFAVAITLIFAGVYGMFLLWEGM